MKQYSWILFDADETLFHFNSKQGLELMREKHNLHFTDEDLTEYLDTNKQLWIDYQNNLITANDIKNTRFQKISQKLDISTNTLNQYFLESMLQISQTIDGAAKIVHYLSNKAKLGVITNGFSDMQQARLDQANLAQYFNLLIISEEVGYPKPNRQIFEFSLQKMNNPNPNEVLIIGDTLKSDILGGNNAGFDTCWFNPHKKPIEDEIVPTFTINHLSELKNML